MPRVIKNTAEALPGNFDALVRMFPPRPIRDQVGYENAQEIIDALTRLPRRSKGQAEYLQTLTILFSSYEEEFHAISTSDITPVDALRDLMDEHSMSASDLGRLLGDRNIGGRILSGARQLSKSHIRKLAEYFCVNPGLFI